MRRIRLGLIPAATVSLLVLAALLPAAARAGTINNFAGPPGTAFMHGYAGDGGPATAALLNAPESVAVDAAGNVYVADNGNFVVRRIDGATGTITTVAGNGSFDYTGDGGPATDASLSNVFGLAFDMAGNLYIADQFNCVIRKVTPPPGASRRSRAAAPSGSSATAASRPPRGSRLPKASPSTPSAISMLPIPRIAASAGWTQPPGAS